MSSSVLLSVLTMIYHADLFKTVTADDGPTSSPITPTPAMPMICNSTICNVTCSNFAQCYNTTIDVSLSHQLFLYCNGEYSCAYLNLINPPNNTTHIYCNHSKSCKSAIFNCSETAETSLHCLASASATSSNYKSCEDITLYATAATKINVYCDWVSCNYATFFVENANIVNFTFAGWQSASDIIIYGYNITDTLHVLCDGQFACENAIIYANSSSLLMDMECRQKYSCRNAQIYCPINSDGCNIECHSSEPCTSMNIFIENNLYNLHLLCEESGTLPACENVNIQCLDTAASTNLTYTDSDLHGLYCDNPHCCPPLKRALCTNDTECVVNCTDGGCLNRYIDGSFATSLTVICDDIYKTCKDAKVQCPIGKSSECAIICGIDYGCQSMLIDALFTSILNITCTAANSCKSLQLIHGPINKANIQCLDSYACAHSTYIANNTYNINLNCINLHYVCGFVQLYAVNALSVNVYCGYLNCHNVDIYANNTQSIRVLCDDSACQAMEIFAHHATNVSVNCSEDKSCFEMGIFCPYSGDDICSIRCTGINGCDSMDIFVHDDYQYRYLDLICGPTGCDLLDIICYPSKNSNTVNVTEYHPERTYSCNQEDHASCCPYIVPTTSAPTFNPTNNPTIDTVSLCASHPQCTHLYGACCPTIEGILLGCCDATYAPTKSLTLTQSTIAPLCSSHSQCKHLDGACCPTVEGIMLGCCDAIHSPISNITLETSAHVVDITTSNAIMNKRDVASSPLFSKLNITIIIISSVVVILCIVIIGVLCWRKYAKQAPANHEENHANYRYNAVHKDSIASKERANKQDSVEMKQSRNHRELNKENSNESMYQKADKKTVEDEKQSKAERKRIRNWMQDFGQYEDEHKQLFDHRDIAQERTNEDRQQIADWLSNIELQEYLKNFVEFGYNHLEIIKDITLREELIEIGIEREKHQNILLNEIFELKHVNEIENESDDVDGVVPVMKTAREKYVIEWNTRDLVNWIKNLENGRYETFVDKLSVKFNEEQVTGRNMKDVNDGDLRYYGVKSLSDRKDLLKHIQDLVTSELYQPQVEGQIETNK